MTGRTVAAAALLGLLAALVSAYVFSLHAKPLPPAFRPASDPFTRAIYAQGIVESEQASGENINLDPEVSGPVTRVFVREGQTVRAGEPLIAVDDQVQRATAEQQGRQAEAALALLAELRAEPRPETLEVSRAQLVQATANLRLAQATYEKQERSYDLDPRSISRDALDTAANAARVAAAAADVARRQYELTRAGAWRYDVENQQRQAEALVSAHRASQALLSKYVLRAPTSGVVLAVNAPLGGYVASSGVYDTYTQGQAPVVVMSSGLDGGGLEVRCYVDEILVQQLPAPDRIRAVMSVRGSDARIPLQFVRVQPYLTPKIELSDQRQERVDLRVLPVIFRFARRPGVAVYPGQLADVYIGRR